MKLLKQAMAVLGTVMVVAIIAALVTPKTAHAIVATLVEVVNTTANPAITQDTSKQASQILTLYCPSTSSLMPCYQLDEQGVLSTIQYTVPSTSHYVITSIDFEPNGLGTAQNRLALTNNYDTTHTYYFIQINNVTNFNITQLSFIGLVIGPTTKPAIVNQVGFSEGSIWLHGYLTAN
jgi:hypothetical protein